MIGPGEILSSLNILQQLGKFWNWLRAKRHPPLESLPARFIRLFESHGVHRNQIPRYFGQGLTLRDIQDEAALLAKLDETLLEAACTHFAVYREWLDGADRQVYDIHDFYQQPEDFADFIETLRADNPEGELSGVLIAPKEVDKDAGALLVLEEAVGDINEKTINRYHFCNYSTFGYWKARAYLTACVAIACRHQIPITGIYLPSKEIAPMAKGETPGWDREVIFARAARRWHPEAMALQPEAFLKRIDPEQDHFGIKAGLKLWLELESQGHMATTLENESARLRFEQALATYSSAR